MNEEALKKAFEDLLGQIEVKVPELVKKHFEELQKAQAEATEQAAEQEAEETVEVAKAEEPNPLEAEMATLREQLAKAQKRIADLEKVSKADEAEPRPAEEPDWVKESDQILRFVNAK